MGRGKSEVFLVMGVSGEQECAPDWRCNGQHVAAALHLLKEQDDLHAFQAKSDAAREEIGRGGVSADRLDELDSDLKTTMPEAVRRKLGNEGPAREAGRTTEGVQRETIYPGLQNIERRPATFSPM